MEDQYVPLPTIERLNTLIESKEYIEFLTISLGFRRSMAFLDHEQMTEKLLIAWNLLDEFYSSEKKKITRIIKGLDNKADPDYIQKLNDSRANFEEKRAMVMVTCGQLKLETRVPLEMFKDDSFDSMAFYKTLKSETWINKSLGK